jgi:hypothetical protein
MRNSIFLLVFFFCATILQAQNVKVSLKLEQGKVYKLVVESKTVVTQDVLGQKSNLLMRSEGTTAFRVKSFDKAGYLLDVCFEKMLFSVQTPQGLMEFSSDKKESNDIISMILSAMVNKSFVVELAANGKVLSVEGIQNIFSAIVKQYPNLSVEQGDRIRSQIMKSFGENVVKGNLNQVTAILPGKTVTKGEKWMIKSKLELAMNTNSKTTLELSEVADNYIVVKGSSDLVTADKKSEDDIFGIPMLYNLTGKIVFEVKIDRASGWPINATFDQDITGTGTIPPNDNLPDGMTIPMTIKTTNNISN